MTNLIIVGIIIAALIVTGSGFVSGFALQKVQFQAQMLMAKLAQNPC